MGLLPRLKSDKKLQAEALDILSEMIHRELLNVMLLRRGTNAETLTG